MNVKKFIILASVLISPLALRSEETKTKFNPFTGKLDFITSLSTNSIQAGTNITVTTTTSGVTIGSTAGGGGGTTIWGQNNEVVVSNAVSTMTTNGVIKSSVTASGKYGVFLNFNTSQFTNTASTFTANPSSVTLQGNNLSATYLTNSSAAVTYVTTGTSNFIRNTLTPPTTTQQFSVAFASAAAMQVTSGTVKGGTFQAITPFGSVFSVGDADDAFYFESAVYPGHKLSLRGGQAVMASDTGGTLDLASDGTATFSNTYAAQIYLGSIAASFDAPDSGLDGGSLNLIGGDGASGAGGPIYITGGLSGGNPVGGEIIINGGSGGTTNADVVLNTNARVHSDGQIEATSAIINSNMILEASQITTNGLVPMVLNSGAENLYIDDGSTIFRIGFNPTLGDAALTGTVNAATGTFSDRLQVGGEDVCREGGTDCPTFAGMTPGASYYVRVDGAGTQAGAFNISSGTINGNSQFFGSVVIDTPTVAVGVGANRAALSFNPVQTSANLNLRSYSLSAGNGGLFMQDSSGYQVSGLNLVPQLSGNIVIRKATDSVAGLTDRYTITPISKHIFANAAGTAFVEFDPLYNSSFTIPVYMKSSATVAGQLTVTSIKFPDGTVQVSSPSASVSSSGSGSSPVAAAGSIYLSNQSTLQTGITSTPSKLIVFSTGGVLGSSLLTAPSTTTSQIVVSTTATFAIQAAIVSTGPYAGTTVLHSWIAVNGATTSISSNFPLSQTFPVVGAQLFPPRVWMMGEKALTAGDTVAIYVSIDGSGGSLMVNDASLVVTAVGGVTTSGTIPSSTTVTTTYKAAVCQGPNVSLGFSGFAASTPTATCVSGTNSIFGVAQYVDTSTRSVQDHFQLPAGWIGNIDANIVWRSTQTSGNVVWKMRTACVADAEIADPSWNTESTVTDAAKGTTLQFNTAAMSALTITGCAAGEELFFDFTRDPAHASDTLAATADLISIQFVLRRTIF